LVTIIGFILVEVAILTYGSCIVLVYAMERVSIFIWLVDAMAFAAVFYAFELINATLSIGRILTQTTFAQQLDGR
jgi:hypothetical protein